MKPSKYAEQRKYKYTKHRSGNAPKRMAVQTCSVCGKQCFSSSRVARDVAGRLAPGTRIRVYQCNGFWHQTSVPAETMSRYREQDFRRAQHGESHC